MSKKAALEFPDSPNSSAISHAISELRSYLPSQGPIDNFIHHNTFHDFEHVAFEEAVEHIARILGGEPYLPHDEFREALLRGRITDTDIEAEVADRVGAKVKEGEDLSWKKNVLVALLRIPESTDGEQTIRWWLQDGGGLKTFDRMVRSERKKSVIERSQPQTEAAALQTLWSAVEKRLQATKNPLSASKLLVESHSEDRSLNDVTIRIIGAYLDRGTARWQMPERDRGLWHCTLQLAKHSNPIASETVDRLREDEKFKQLSKMDGLNACGYLLSELDPTRKSWQDLIQTEFLALPGWAGMIATLEERGELLDSARTYPALVDYIALRLFLRRHTPKQAPVPLAEPVSYHRASFAAQMFRTAQVLGLSASDIETMPANRWQTFCETLAESGDFVRRRILHSAYERTYRKQFFAALSYNARQKKNVNQKPKFQAMFCLDEREESFRRHLEDAEPACMTFGAAGFFGIDMLFHPHDSVLAEPFCPAVITPRHVIRESLANTSSLNVKPQFKKILKVARNRFWGAPLLPSAALLDSSRLFFNVHFPIESALIRRKLNPSKHALTQFAMSRDPSEGAVNNVFSGYTVTEMSDRIETILRMTGLTRNFSDTVFLIGHGSTTTNNHFQSAYDCGACGGRRGQYNSRMFAFMANREDVRAELQTRGITIPKETLFVGGIHDTCSEDVVLYDMDDPVQAHKSRIAEARVAFDEARGRNARERFRRFGDTRSVDQNAALAKVQTRANHAAEVRPEYGHGSNAVSFVGRRSTTRGLFLDRRCFLTSYDASQDLKGEILKKILSAIMPVCGGINLEYYFSRVDNVTYGCGSKLPHNLTAMIGVVDGPASDLRAGLPWQTVEIHEPMRLLTILEGEVDFLTGVLSDLPVILEHFDCGWGQLAVLSPSTNDIYLRVNGSFVKQTSFESCIKTPSSRAYYDGRSDHLPPAIVTGDLTKETAHAS